MKSKRIRMILDYIAAIAFFVIAIITDGNSTAIYVGCAIAFLIMAIWSSVELAETQIKKKRISECEKVRDEQINQLEQRLAELEKKAEPEKQSEERDWGF